MISAMKKDGKLKLIVVDPQVTEAAALADIHLQARPGTDAALMLGMLNVIIKEDLYDKDFVSKWCYGFDKLARRVEDYPPEKVAQITGVPAEKIREASRMYATNKPGIVRNGQVVEMIPNASQALLAAYLLPAITGNIDIPGGQYFAEPHPTMGLVADLECSDSLAPEQKAKLIGHEEFPLFSSWDNFLKIYKNWMKVRSRPMAKSWWYAGFANAPMAWRAILTGKPYPVKAMVSDASNTLLAFPNAKLVYQAMKKLEFQINMDIWMTPSAMLADYVLPAACYLEKPAFRHAGDIIGTRTPCGEAAISPMYERKDEFQFYRELGIRLGQDWPWKNLEEAFDERLRPLGLTFKQGVEQRLITAPMNFKKYEKVGFGTPTGKVELYNTTLEELGFDPLPSYQEWSQGPFSVMAKEYPMILTSRRAREYAHSDGRQIASTRKKYPDPIARLNPAKASELGIKDGDWIWVETKLGRIRFKCQYAEMLPNVVSVDIMWWFPEDAAEEPSLYGVWKSNINVILDDDPSVCCDPLTGAWTMRAVMCKVYKDPVGRRSSTEVRSG